MARRSTLPRVLDDRAFPIRVLVKNADGDTLHLRFTEAQAWLNENIGRGEWAMHSQSSIGLLAMGIYFRSIDAATRFFEANPRFELIDTTHQFQHIQAQRNPRKPLEGEPTSHSTPGLTHRDPTRTYD